MDNENILQNQQESLINLIAGIDLLLASTSPTLRRGKLGVYRAKHGTEYTVGSFSKNQANSDFLNIDYLCHRIG